MKNTATFPQGISVVKDSTPACRSHADPKPVPRIGMVVLYGAVASFWMTLTSRWWLWLPVDSVSLSVGVGLQALNVVLTTAVLLFCVLRHAYNGWRIAEKHRSAECEHARQQSRRLSTRVQTLREEDRAWIAREIHDELGQLLTGIKMQLRLVEDRLADRGDRTLNPLIDKLVESSEMVDNTIASVQRIAAGLRPSSLDHFGLAIALNEEAEQFSHRTGIPCVVKLGKVPEILPAAINTAVFRIFQESLTNVARHAQAHRIDVAFDVSGVGLELVVHDDGMGIDPGALDHPKSLGLIGMSERAESVGGWIRFEQISGKGTTVTLTIPVSSLEHQLDLGP
ncbi:MAG: sensor histidine kinase [Akkermansiaceae bacterium]|nr:sensor histidine kinase [Akkermansiaceae bacterium]